MTINDLTFPVLMFSKDGTVTAIRDVDEITIGSAGAIHRGYYKNLLIIDSAGIRYVVIDAVIEGRYNIFHRIMELFVFRRIRLQLRFKEEQQRITLDEMKHLFKKTSKSLFSGGDPGYNSILRKAINDASSTGEIVNLITKWDRGEL